MNNTPQQLTAQPIAEIAGKRKPGRPKGSTSANLWYKARGINPLTAAEILARANEDSLWRRVLRSEDERIVLQALIYLTDRRDGRPAQQINVTSQSVNINADSLERARAIVRELRGESEQIAKGEGKANLLTAHNLTSGDSPVSSESEPRL